MGVPLMQKKDAAHELLLSALHGSKNPLEYLTANDWMLLVDRAKLVTFAKDEFLLHQGKQARALYLLLRGKARVEIGPKAEIAHLGPGEVCGEMAFLENSVASATVIAVDKIEAYAIEWSALSDLFELFPHLGSRFYRSLAVNLSRRLRSQLSHKALAK